MERSNHTYAVFGMEAGNFVWFASYETLNEAESEMDNFQDRVDFLFIIKCKGFFRCFDEAPMSAEKLNAIRPEEINVTLDCGGKIIPHTPYNLVSGMAALKEEFKGVDSPEAFDEYMKEFDV